MKIKSFAKKLLPLVCLVPVGFAVGSSLKVPPPPGPFSYETAYSDGALVFNTIPTAFAGRAVLFIEQTTFNCNSSSLDFQVQCATTQGGGLGSMSECHDQTGATFALTDLATQTPDIVCAGFETGSTMEGRAIMTAFYAA